MKEMNLTQESLKEILTYNPESGDFERIVNSRRRPNAKIKAGCISKSGYIAIYIRKNSYYAHRLAWLYIYGEWPEENLDHINGVRSDNRIKNLRKADCADNSENRHKQSHSKGSGLKLGVTRKNGTLKRPYVANIQKNGKTVHLGYFETEELAYHAYLTAKRLLHAFCTI